MVAVSIVVDAVAIGLILLVVSTRAPTAGDVARLAPRTSFQPTQARVGPSVRRQEGR